MKKHIMSVFPGFGIGGAQVRYAMLANRFANEYSHTIVSLNGNTACREKLSEDVAVDFVDFSAHRGLSAIPGMRKFVRSIDPDVLITSNWGSIEWSLAGYPHIHTEDGFGPEEEKTQLLRRVIARNILLRRAVVIVPSQTLLAIARKKWRLPEENIRYIPNGIDTKKFISRGFLADQDKKTFCWSRDDANGMAGPAWTDENPFTIGTVATLRREKNIHRLIRVFSALSVNIRCRLIIVGDGPEKAGLEAVVGQLGLADRVTFTGHIENSSAMYREFDVFALTSDTEQMPFSVLEAMSSGVPVVTTDVGDVRSMLTHGNHPFIYPRSDEDGMVQGLINLAENNVLRQQIGIENRARVESDYDMEGMFLGHRSIIDAVIQGAWVGSKLSSPRIPHSSLRVPV